MNNWPLKSKSNDILGYNTKFSIEFKVMEVEMNSFPTFRNLIVHNGKM